MVCEVSGSRKMVAQSSLNEKGLLCKLHTYCFLNIFRFCQLKNRIKIKVEIDVVKEGRFYYLTLERPGFYPEDEAAISAHPKILWAYDRLQHCNVEIRHPFFRQVTLKLFI